GRRGRPLGDLTAGARPEPRQPRTGLHRRRHPARAPEPRAARPPPRRRRRRPPRDGRRRRHPSPGAARPPPRPDGAPPPRLAAGDPRVTVAAVATLRRELLATVLDETVPAVIDSMQQTVRTGTRHLWGNVAVALANGFTTISHTRAGADEERRQFLDHRPELS